MDARLDECGATCAEGSHVRRMRAVTGPVKPQLPQLRSVRCGVGSVLGISSVRVEASDEPIGKLTRDLL